MAVLNPVTIPALSDQELDRVIEMAWEDRTSFEAIHYQFGLSEAEVIALMRAELKASSFRSWRKRVTGRRTKHAITNPSNRFRASCQRLSDQGSSASLSA